MTNKQKKILFRIIIASVISIVVYIIPIDGIFKLLLFIVPYLIAGYDVLYTAFRNILNGQVFNENFLMSIATAGAFFIGEYPEAAAVMIFYQIGELFQKIAVGKSRKSIAALMDIKSETVTVLRNGSESVISPEEANVAEIMVIRPGERIPLDGVIISGETTVDTSSLTGESLPSALTIGDSIVSGTVNLSGVIKAEIKSLYTESTVAKILELTENAAEKKAVTENFITRFARYYIPIVVISALMIAILPPIFIGNWSAWIKRALIFLVVSCPCALVVSVPLSFFGSIGGASKKGILFKGAGCIERLAKVNAVVFDKTGTLTEGGFSVTDIQSTEISEKELLRLAASAEIGSNHPIAICISNSVSEDDLLSVDKITELAGFGIEALIGNKKYFIGNMSLMNKNGIRVDVALPLKTCVHISDENKYLGYIAVEDKIKADSLKSIRELKALGIKKLVMLTGDNKSVAEKTAETVGIDSYFAELLPADKVNEVENMLSEGYSVAFVGDGINDSPVLSRADVGIAMGAYGSDAAIEAADIVIMDDKPSHISAAVRISRNTMKIVKENIVFALLVKGIILILGAFGFANMWIAVFGDVGVTVLAILNSIRTLYFK